MKEIIAARIGSKITNDFATIRNGILSGKDYELLDRKRLQLMASMDLGKQWEDLAKSPTLFYITKEGNLTWNPPT